MDKLIVFMRGKKLVFDEWTCMIVLNGLYRLGETKRAADFLSHVEKETPHLLHSHKIAGVVAKLRNLPK